MLSRPQILLLWTRLWKFEQQIKISFFDISVVYYRSLEDIYFVVG